MYTDEVALYAQPLPQFCAQHNHSCARDAKGYARCCASHIESFISCLVSTSVLQWAVRPDVIEHFIISGRDSATITIRNLRNLGML